MGFQLSIAEGKEAGREFVFEQGNVTIGRSSDCDVVLYDPGVSRRHARIFAEGDGYVVEDLASANGTKVNGTLVKRQRLEEGDLLTLGPVVFAFVPTELPQPQTDEAEVAEQSTRIVSLAQVKKKAALAPNEASEGELQAMAGRATRAMPAVSRPRPSASLPARGAESRPRPARLAKAEAPEAAPALSAVEKARIRRQAGNAAGLKIWWLEASQKTRRLVYGAGAVTGLLLIGALYWAVLVQQDDGPQLPPEPSVLSRQPVEASFGLGPDVMYPRPDMKVFGFEFISPVRALVILHFQASDISAGEVVVSANGVEVGQVPPDTLASADRMLELVIPAAVLKNGEMNQVIFDNTHNPPGEDTWKIWNVRITPESLPELPVEQLQAEAKESFDRGLRFFERKEIGAENRYQAWQDFRRAWLLLEGHPEPKPALHLLARTRMREAQQELDATCAKLMLDIQTKVKRRDWTGARHALDQVAMFFPTENDQLCPRRAKELRWSYNL